MRTWRALAASAAVGVALVAASCGRPTPQAGPPHRTSSSTTTPAISSTTAVPTTTTTTAPSTTAPVGVLRPGDRGPAVDELQGQLIRLRYWTGPRDGVFGQQVAHAVTALQKTARINRTGVVDERTRQALGDGVKPVPKSTSGRVVEVDLTRQLVLVVQDGSLLFTFDASTGREAGSTPVGKWKVFRQVDGLDWSDLGLLYRPLYFHEGVAVHGFTEVPPFAASHGCVRVTYEAMDEIWAARLAPIGTPVWVS